MFKNFSTQFYAVSIKFNIQFRERVYFFQPYLTLPIETILQSGRNTNFKTC